MQLMRTDSPQVMGFMRSHGHERILIFANFSKQSQTLPVNLLRLYGPGNQYEDLLAPQPFPTQEIQLEPFQFLA